MAVGNAGPHLDSAADSLCTWLSRDGGRTWADVAPRASIYEFGNSGGIILSARHEADGPTDTISFSADGGEEFFIWGRGVYRIPNNKRLTLINLNEKGGCRAVSDL